MQNLALLQGTALGVKGVGRRQFDAIEKSAAQIFTITKIDAMFCAFTDGKSIFWTRCCVKRWFKRRLLRSESGTQRDLGGLFKALS